MFLHINILIGYNLIKYILLYNINGVDSNLGTKILRTRNVIGRRKSMSQAGGLHMYKEIYYKGIDP